MARGGARPGAGRKVGAVQKVAREARAKAAEAGMLPHELLAAVARGDIIDGQKPTLEQRVDAAKAAAPYYAPRLSNSNVSVRRITSFSELSDAELAALAGEAGDAGEGDGADESDPIH